jgi:hypothetical protein
VVKKAAFFLISMYLYGCATTPEKSNASRISYEQWKVGREKLPEQINLMLSSVRATFESNPKLFDSCFTDDDGKRFSGQGLLVFTVNPSNGKLALADFSSPEPLTGLGHENFGHCSDMILAKMQVSPNPSINSAQVYRNLVKVVWPSWETSKSQGQTEIKPAGMQIANSSVCMKALHQFYSVSPWEVWKQGSQYFSDNHQKVGEKEVFLCSGQDIEKALKFDEMEIRRQYSMTKEAAVVDGIF